MLWLCGSLEVFGDLCYGCVAVLKCSVIYAMVVWQSWSVWWSMLWLCGSLEVFGDLCYGCVAVLKCLVIYAMVVWQSWSVWWSMLWLCGSLEVFGDLCYGCVAVLKCLVIYAMVVWQSWSVWWSMLWLCGSLEVFGDLCYGCVAVLKCLVIYAIYMRVTGVYIFPGSDPIAMDLSEIAVIFPSLCRPTCHCLGCLVLLLLFCNPQAATMLVFITEHLLGIPVVSFWELCSKLEN